MVDKFHEADLEIWLDVVFNHTAEFGDNGYADHFKLLAPDQWYLREKDESYKNYSGCGNTLNCVLQLALVYIDLIRSYII